MTDSDDRDLSYWTSMRTWRLFEAAYLLAGELPRSDEASLAALRAESGASGRLYRILKDAARFEKDLAVRDDLRPQWVGHLAVASRDAIEWARRRGVPIPANLAAVATTRPSRPEVSANPFASVPGLRWEDLSIEFVSLVAVRIRARGEMAETVTYEALGFRNGKSRTDTPRLEWETFRVLALAKGDWRYAEAARTLDSGEIENFKSRIRLVRQHLKKFFGISEDPIAGSRAGYKTAFALSVSDEVQRSLAAGVARSDNDTDQGDEEYPVDADPDTDGDDADRFLRRR